MRTNKASEGRPPLVRIHALIRDHYRWFDYLRARRGDLRYRALEDAAWAAWRPVLKNLKSLRATQRALHKAVVTGEPSQLNLNLEGANNA
ncbi:MAG: hypothetical protein ACXABY_30700 [Candidatus Thorarchaeota archaeon]|jgi:hypothetical protein